MNHVESFASRFCSRGLLVSIFFVAVVLSGLLAGCKKEQPKPQAPPPEVSVIKVDPGDVPVTFEYVAQTQSSQQVEIRARVSGFLDKRTYTEGAIVKEGEVLFLMDKKPFQAQLDAMQGALGQQQARLQTARSNLTRIRPLAAQNAVSQKDLDDAIGVEQAAAAAVETAKSLYYPAISLTAAFGYSSTDLSKLFKSPAQIWSIAAPVVAPIFTAGAIRGQVKLAEARQQELVVRYQQVIQTAFREVDDFLVEQKETKPQLEALGRRTTALREYARLAQLRFDNGYTSYLEVLDANRSLFDAELNYAQTKATLFRSFVNLYKAMGGGWVAEADKMTGEDISKISSTKGYLLPP